MPVNILIQLILLMTHILGSSADFPPLCNSAGRHDSSALKFIEKSNPLLTFPKVCVLF